VYRKGQRSYPLMADEDLVALVAEGDARAFAALYERHARAALFVARRLSPASGGGHDDAEDLVQAAFLGVWRSAGTYRAERGGVRTWLLSAVRNAGVDGLRCAAKHRRARERAGATAEKTSQPCEAFAEVWRDAVRERLVEALGALPPDQLEVLRLAYLSEHTHSEASELLGIPLGTVKGRARLGLEKVRDHLGCTQQGAAAPR
jgi:RNA polymerase sigma-70 factor (ECF subfamily)